MDPYLEGSSIWPDVHNRLIASLADSLGPVLAPRYYVRLEERTYVQKPGGLEFFGRPDINILRDDDGRRYATGGPMRVKIPMPDVVRETYLRVFSAEPAELITVLEVLSPSNKQRGKGRRTYLRRRLEICDSLTHLVEIDLQRAGERMPIEGREVSSDYRILVSRGDRRPNADLYAFGVRDPIPKFPLPLQRGDKEPEVDLGAILHALYERAAYHKSLDYRVEPVPPVSVDDSGWMHELLRSAHLR